jgi:hypothetical protein
VEILVESEGFFKSLASLQCGMSDLELAYQLFEGRGSKGYAAPVWKFIFFIKTKISMSAGDYVSELNVDQTGESSNRWMSSKGVGLPPPRANVANREKSAKPVAKTAKPVKARIRSLNDSELAQQRKEQEQRERQRQVKRAKQTKQGAAEKVSRKKTSQMTRVEKKETKLTKREREYLIDEPLEEQEPVDLDSEQSDSIISPNFESQPYEVGKFITVKSIDRCREEVARMMGAYDPTRNTSRKSKKKDEHDESFPDTTLAHPQTEDAIWECVTFVMRRMAKRAVMLIHGFPRGKNKSFNIDMHMVPYILNGKTVSAVGLSDRFYPTICGDSITCTPITPDSVSQRMKYFKTAFLIEVHKEQKFLMKDEKFTPAKIMSRAAAALFYGVGEIVFHLVYEGMAESMQRGVTRTIARDISVAWKLLMAYSTPPPSRLNLFDIAARIEKRRASKKKIRIEFPVLVEIASMVENFLTTLVHDSAQIAEIEYFKHQNFKELHAKFKNKNVNERLKSLSELKKEVKKQESRFRVASSGAGWWDGEPDQQQLYLAAVRAKIEGLQKQIEAFEAETKQFQVDGSRDLSSSVEEWSELVSSVDMEQEKQDSRMVTEDTIRTIIKLKFDCMRGSLRQAEKGNQVLDTDYIQKVFHMMNCRATDGTLKITSILVTDLVDKILRHVSDVVDGYVVTSQLSEFSRLFYTDPVLYEIARSSGYCFLARVHTINEKLADSNKSYVKKRRANLLKQKTKFDNLTPEQKKKIQERKKQNAEKSSENLKKGRESLERRREEERRREQERKSQVKSATPKKNQPLQTITSFREKL